MFRTNWFWQPKKEAAIRRTSVSKLVSDYFTRNMPDFEDSVLHEAALKAGAHCIVTRNLGDFVTAQIPVYAPREFLAALENSGS